MVPASKVSHLGEKGASLKEVFLKEVSVCLVDCMKMAAALRIPIKQEQLEGDSLLHMDHLTQQEVLLSQQEVHNLLAPKEEQEEEQSKEQRVSTAPPSDPKEEQEEEQSKEQRVSTAPPSARKEEQEEEQVSSTGGCVEDNGRWSEPPGCSPVRIKILSVRTLHPGEQGAGVKEETENFADGSGCLLAGRKDGGGIRLEAPETHGGSVCKASSLRTKAAASENQNRVRSDNVDPTETRRDESEEGRWDGMEDAPQAGQDHEGGRGQGARRHHAVLDEIRATIIDHVINHGLTMAEAGRRVQPNVPSSTVTSIIQTFHRENGMSSAGTEPGHSRGRRLSRGRGGAGDARSRSPHHPTAWRSEADPDITPQQPMFLPKRTPGVQPPLNVGRPSPGEIFSYFFDVDIINVLCTNTNKNAARNKAKGIWKDIEVEEMQKYLGMLLYMALVKLPKRSDFWRRNSIFHIPFPGTVMPRDRFMAISDNLHMSDPEEDSQNDAKKGTAEHDPLHRLRPLLEMIRNRCMRFYHPKQHISVDERLIATKARVGIQQYMKAKPTKRGLKCFVLTDVNAYTIDFRLYTGKNWFASGKGLSFDVVASLVNKQFLGSGYVIYCNFHSSPLLFRHLGQQGFGACGTYRQGRVGVPSTLENALEKRSPRGTIRWIRDGDLLYVKWMDRREVSLITSIHPVYSGETVLRWQKTGDGQLQRVPIPRPTAVSEYNKYMGRVDTSDQMLGTNSVHRKTMRWPITVFQHFLDIAATNSFILHKELASQRQEKPMTRQAFQEQLCAHLLGVTVACQPKKPPTHDHFPVPTSTGHDNGKQQRASMGRRQCVLCKRSTPWKCEECNVGLCLQLDRNCFRQFHKG